MPSPPFRIFPRDSTPCTNALAFCCIPNLAFMQYGENGYALRSSTEYDKLARLSAPLPGSTSSLLPPVFLRVIINLDESLANANAGGKKSKLNATSAKALTAVKQKIKKATRDNEAILSDYKAVRCPPSILRREQSFLLRRMLRLTRLFPLW